MTPAFRASIANIIVAILILIWTLVPIYHTVMIALSPSSAAMSQLWPAAPTLENFGTVLTESHFLVQNFWSQLFNSIFVAVTVTVLTLAIALPATFAISRLRVRGGEVISASALLTYLIPASFLAVPMYVTMVRYDLVESSWSLILIMVTFATPYAIWVFRQYADSIPDELDEAARIDGASAWQIMWHVFLPLMMPSIIAIGTYALLSAWNEYLYAFLMLSQSNNMTLPVALGYFLMSDDSPWNLLMALGILYSLPPALLYYVVRNHMTSGLTSGAVKG